MMNHNNISIPGSIGNRGKFLLLGDFPGAAPPMPALAAKGLAFFQQIDRKYRCQQSFENFPLYFLRLAPGPVPVTIEYSLCFKPVFRWVWQNNIHTRYTQPENGPGIRNRLEGNWILAHFQFPTDRGRRDTGPAMASKLAADVTHPGKLNAHSLTPYITQFLTLSLTQSLTQSLIGYLGNNLFSSPRLRRIYRELFLPLRNLADDYKTRRPIPSPAGSFNVSIAWISLQHTWKKEIGGLVEEKATRIEEQALETRGTIIRLITSLNRDVHREQLNRQFYRYRFPVVRGHRDTGTAMAAKLAAYVAKPGKLTTLSLAPSLTRFLTPSLVQSLTVYLRNSLFYSPGLWKICRELFPPLKNVTDDYKTHRPIRSSSSSFNVSTAWISLQHTWKKEIGGLVEENATRIEEQALETRGTIIRLITSLNRDVHQEQVNRQFYHYRFPIDRGHRDTGTAMAAKSAAPSLTPYITQFLTLSLTQSLTQSLTGYLKNNLFSSPRLRRIYRELFPPLRNLVDDYKTCQPIPSPAGSFNVSTAWLSLHHTWKREIGGLVEENAARIEERALETRGTIIRLITSLNREVHQEQLNRQFYHYRFPIDRGHWDTGTAMAAKSAAYVTKPGKLTTLLLTPSLTQSLTILHEAGPRPETNAINKKLWQELQNTEGRKARRFLRFAPSFFTADRPGQESIFMAVRHNGWRHHPETLKPKKPGGFPTRPGYRFMTMFTESGIFEPFPASQFILRSLDDGPKVLFRSIAPPGSMASSLIIPRPHPDTIENLHKRFGQYTDPPRRGVSAPTPPLAATLLRSLTLTRQFHRLTAPEIFHYNWKTGTRQGSNDILKLPQGVTHPTYSPHSTYSPVFITIGDIAAGAIGTIGRTIGDRQLKTIGLIPLKYSSPKAFKTCSQDTALFGIWNLGFGISRTRAAMKSKLTRTLSFPGMSSFTRLSPIQLQLPAGIIIIGDRQVKSDRPGQKSIFMASFLMIPRPHPETNENRHKRTCAAYRPPSPRGLHEGRKEFKISRLNSDINSNFNSNFTSSMKDNFKTTLTTSEREILRQIHLENRITEPGNDTPDNRETFPELPAFEKEGIEKRYTSIFYLTGTPSAAAPVSMVKDIQSFLSPQLWLSSNSFPGVRQNLDSIEFPWKTGTKAGTLTSLAPRAISLRSVVEEGYTDSHPAMTHFSRAGNDVPEIRIKKIEQTIVTHAKQLENRLKDAVKTSGAASAFTGSTAVQQGVKLSNLVDGVYKMILDRIKRERSMRGY